jgi:hypothetical protein
VGRATSAVMILGAACSGSATGTGADAGSALDAAAPGPVDAAPSSGDVTLVETSWTLPPRTERYYCVRRTVDRDLHIGRFEAIAPRGTHHTVLTIDDGDEPDGVTTCLAATSAPRMIYGSGVGTRPHDLPAGVAMKVSAGQQLLLNLHLYNTSPDQPLSGTSGVRARLVRPEDVVHEAEVVLAGTIDLRIAPGASMQYGRCTMPGDVTIFAAGSHMHRLGVHLEAVVERTGQVLVDRPYSFDDQNAEPVEARLVAGDRVLVECSYENDTGDTVFFGQSSDQEMCFAVLFRYPAQGRHHVCLD